MEKLCPLRPWTEGTRLIPWLGGFNLFPKRGKYFLFRTHEDKKFKMICVFYWRWRNQQNPIQRFSQLRVGSLWRCTKNCGGAKTCGGAKKKLWRGGHRSETAIFQAFFVALINDEWRWSWWSWFNNELWSTPRDLWPLRHLTFVSDRLPPFFNFFLPT